MFARRTESRISEVEDDEAASSTSASSCESESSASDAGDVDDACTSEVTALCWSGASVGVARYLCAECRIEVFETPVCVIAGEAVRRSSAKSSAAVGNGKNGGAGEGEMRILVFEDVPASLLWLVRYLEVHRPQVLLPHQGSEALSDVVGLVSVRAPLEVLLLSAATAFNAAEALPRLCAMYPAQATELAHRFHASNTAMLRAMAALLQFLAAGQANVADVVQRGVLHALYMEDACAEALQITRTEQHPSSAQGRGRAKEGLSLRGLLSTGQSSLGKAMLRQWFALPCCDVAEIEARQSVVAFFAHVEHQGVAAQLRAALHHVRATSHIFTTMRSGRAVRKHYVSLHRTLRGVIEVQRLLAVVAHSVERLFVLLQSISVEPLLGMAASIARAIAGVATSRTTMQNRVADEQVETSASAQNATERGANGAAVHINDGVDAMLDELRLRLHDLRLSLQAKAEVAFAQLPLELRTRLSLRCVYAVPHGYLLCVPAAELVAVIEEYLPDDVVDGEARDPSVNNNEDGVPDGFDSVSEAETPREASMASRAGAEEAAGGASSTERVCQFMQDAFQWLFHHATQDGDFCFKSQSMDELDVWVGDLQRRVQQREQHVRHDLDTSLLFNSLHLLRPTRALGELDCLLSFARVSAQEGWCRPHMCTSCSTSRVSTKAASNSGQPLPLHQNDGDPVALAQADTVTVRRDGGDDACEDEHSGGVLEIESGWHPLLSRHLDMQQLVPFSLQLHTVTDRVCLILGVNGSGKSVLMGAVAHIVFLAHIGCHVPAVAVRLSLINGIFAPSSYCSSASCAAGVVPAMDQCNAESWRREEDARGGGPRGRRAGVTASCSSHWEAEAAQSSFYSECVALHRVLHHVAGQLRAVAADVCDRTRAAADASVMAPAAPEAAARVGEGTPPQQRLPDPNVGRALVLLDEFGRGTSPEDGCALLKGTLQYFATDCADVSPSRAPIVLCATHLVEMLDPPKAPPTASAASLPLTRASLTGMTAEDDDPPLPLEWVKIYDMETLPTYAPEDDVMWSEQDGACSGAAHDGFGGVEAARRKVPVDVTPTYQPVCVTTHTGVRRWEDWHQHAGAHLDAGPALGRQCGLDGELLECWEAALRVLHAPPPTT